MAKVYFMQIIPARISYSLVLASMLLAACSQARPDDASITYQLSWGTLPIATVEDYLEFNKERYLINSELNFIDWLDWTGLPSSLERTVNGNVSNSQLLLPNFYTQRYGSRETSIRFSYTNNTIHWADSKRGIFEASLPQGGAFDTLSVMYMFYRLQPPANEFLVQFVDGKRLREYRFQSDLTAIEIETAAGSYPTFRYKCTTKPVVIWYAPDLDWLPLKVQIGEGLGRFQFELISVNSSTS